MANNTTKIHFAKVQKFDNKWLSYKENKEKKYVKSGDDNSFPNHLIELYHRSAIHSSCVNAIVEGIIGGGLTANVEDYLSRANYKESWNDIYTKISLDYYLHGSFALEVIWSRDRSKIAEVYHIDYSNVRCLEKDERGNIPGYFISSEWNKRGRYSTTPEEALYLPSYNPLLKEEHPNQLYVFHKYTPGKEYYPNPVYNGALRVIELDQAIDNFHLSNIQNGLAPSLAITTFTNSSKEDLRAIEDMLRANYGGPENAGSLLYLDVDSPENAPKIEPIPQNGADSYYTDINDISMQKILTAHRITSPMMLGIKTEGQLGGRDEVIDAFLLFNNTVIAPLQQDILGSIEKLLEVNYPDITIGVETKQLYEDGTVEEEVITSVETNEAEDNLLNL